LASPVEIRAAAQWFPGEHGRVSDAAAKLFLGVRLFLNFAESADAIDANEKTALLAEAADALAPSAERTGQQQAERLPTVLFLCFIGRFLVCQTRGHVKHHEDGHHTEECLTERINTS
jgi:hypothetical protein